MVKLILLGGGKIGSAIAAMLGGTGDYQITVADKDAESLKRLPTKNVRTMVLDVADPAALRAAMKGHEIVVSAMPYHLTPVIAGAAKDVRRALFRSDGRRREHARGEEARARARTRRSCRNAGLAPGFISIVAHDMTKKFESLRDVNMRVGALPVYPTNALKYNLTWSTDGLINEYCNPCEAIVDGQLARDAGAWKRSEHFSLDGIDYEAFNTSGGLGTLCETLAGPGREFELQDRALSGAPRYHQDLGARFALGAAARHSERRARNGDPDHVSRRGAGVRDGVGPAARAI